MFRKKNPIIVGAFTIWVNPAKISMVNPCVFRLIVISEPVQKIPVWEIHQSNSGCPERIHRIDTNATQASCACDQFRKMRPSIRDPKRITSCLIALGITHIVPPPRNTTGAIIKKLSKGWPSRILVLGFGIRVPLIVIPIPAPFAHVARDVI